MPLLFDRDDSNRRLKMTVTDPVTGAELITAAERQFAEGMWPYGTLVDGRALTMALPRADLQLFIARVQELVAEHGPRGPVAFVGRHSTAIGSVQIYMLFGGKTDSLEVFWDMPEAKEWLDKQMTPTPR